MRFAGAVVLSVFAQVSLGPCGGDASRCRGNAAARGGARAMSTAAVLQRPSWPQRLKPLLVGYDPWLALAIALLAGIGLVTMYSAGFDHGTRFVDHGRNMLLALGVLFLVAQGVYLARHIHDDAPQQSKD